MLIFVRLQHAVHVNRFLEGLVLVYLYQVSVFFIHFLYVIPFTSVIVIFQNYKISCLLIKIVFYIK